MVWHGMARLSGVRRWILICLFFFLSSELIWLLFFERRFGVAEGIGLKACVGLRRSSCDAYHIRLGDIIRRVWTDGDET